jgi:hypothetical protein
MATTENEFTVPPARQRLTPTRVRALGDTLRVHFKERRGGGISPAAVEKLVERFAAELEARDQTEASLAAAKDQVTAKLKDWQTNYVEEHGVARGPTAAEVTTYMNAQFQADRELARARREVADTAIPDPPQPTGDLATDYVARTQWVTTALPAAEEHADVLRSAVPAVEQQVVDLRDETERLTSANTLAGAILPSAEAEPATEAQAS